MNFIKKLFKGKIKHNFVSEVDKFLMQFRQQNPQKSASQLAEIKKFARIAQLRDPIRSK